MSVVWIHALSYNFNNSVKIVKKKSTQNEYVQFQKDYGGSASQGKYKPFILN